MQAQAQISGQVLGQVSGQLSGVPHQNSNSLPSQGSNIGGWRRTWQLDDADASIRRTIMEKILQFLHKRKPQVSSDWQQKLPDLVKRLEGSLYRGAASKEEYADLSTLEQRLQDVVMRRPTPRNSQNYVPHGMNAVSSSSIGSMIPTPGMPSIANGSTMIPTPGSDITMVPTPGIGNMIPNSAGIGNMLPSNSNSIGSNSNSIGPPLQNHGMASAGNISNMVPTPGLGNNLFSTPLESTAMPGNLLVAQQGLGNMSRGQSAQMVPNMGMTSAVNQMTNPGLNPTQTMGVSSNSSAGMAFSNVDNATPAQLQQQQQFNAGSGGHIYLRMNGQLGGGIPNNMQRKNSPFGFANGGIANRMQPMGNGQQRINGNTSFSNTTGYMNPTQFGHAQMQPQQHMNQQGQHHLNVQSTAISGHITPIGGDGYAMNAADLAGPTGYYTPVSSAGLSANSIDMASLGLQNSKMLPVPGLSSQQPNLESQQQLQPSRAQVLDQSQAMKFQQNSSGLGMSQQQQQLSKTKSLCQGQLPSKLFGQKQTNVGLQHEGAQQTSSSMPSTRTLYDQPQHPQSAQHHHHQQEAQQQHDRQIQAAQQQQAQKQQEPHPVPYQQVQGPQQNSVQPQMQQDVGEQQEVQLQKLQQQGIGQQQQDSHQKPQQHVLSQEDVMQPQQPQQVIMNGSISIEQTTSRTGAVPSLALSPGANVEGQRAQQYVKQQRWLLFLRHASKCTAPEGQCPTTPHCHTARHLWGHITKCTDRDCQYARCNASRTLLRHHQQCRDASCPVCGPVRQIFVQQRTQAALAQAGQGHSSATFSSNVASVTGKQPSTSAAASIELSTNKAGGMQNNTTQVQPPPAKRAKIEPPQQLETHQNLVFGATKNQTTLQIPLQTQTVSAQPLVIKSEVPKSIVKTEGGGPSDVPLKSETQASLQLNVPVHRLVQVKTETSNQSEVEPGFRQVQSSVLVKTEPSSTVTSKGAVQVKQEMVATASPTTGPDVSTNTKSGKPKIKGVSLTELFTPEQVKEHIAGLRQWVGQSKAKAEKNQAMEHHMSENSCQLCAVEKLTFEPPPIYCTPCGARIKRNAHYWTMGSGETRHYFCILCYNEIRNDTVEVDGITFPKSRLERKKNDEEPEEEAWVQCDKCELWQHQVCALFNGRRNEGGQAEYTCPYCYIAEIEKGERKPLPQSAVLGAKDLPRTVLSDHIEQRLARRLKQERLERAQSQGKSYDEVPGAESLVVRVVSSVDKKLEVKQHFLEIFQEEDYPTEFPYKSKVLLLFQKIEGVEVFLFGMYVQEFGAECSQPNQRRTYLSYLDSVKYFRPDVKTVNGEALRTFVYHEILIGYLDYCKSRGLTSCYIWACPPLKGEDYILYCHPEIQKTPKSDKLREWYLTMLRKAINENIVLEITNLYDHFFVCTGESKAKVTASRLPYFDGDYWPGAAEDMIMQLQQEEEDGRKLQKKGKTKKTATKRASKAASQAELASNASKDLQLMHKLGESILPMKEDFIMVHLQYACTHCCNFIVSGNRWACKQCKNFRLCDGCNEAEQKVEDRDRHPINCKEVHQLFPVEVNDVPSDTKDMDEIMESEFFDTRQAFLSLCQGNHYQYDTLRRAKHSSMMVLYHLHNPTAPAFVTTCNMCHHDIETGQGWRCETCPDFDLCNACYQMDNSIKHPHKLSPHPSSTEREAQNKEARQQRVLQLRKMLDLLVHASQCCSAQCQYPNCRKVKGLFRHGMNCKTRASGGCPLCKKMWYLLQLHARACKESECRVPRCKDLKEHLRRLQQQMESRRRAAVMEMMRQRAAEAAGSTS